MPTPFSVVVTGSIVTTPDGLDELLEASLAHVHRSRTEHGCVEHGVYRDAEDPLRLFFFERWTDRAALEAHGAQPGSAEFLSVVARLAVGRPFMDVIAVEGGA